LSAQSSDFRLVVSVGTDHHQFDRLIDWTEVWLAENPDTTALVQHGTTRPARGATNFELLPHADLLAALQEADAVVLQGGPGGIMDARSQGIKPIVVPRDPAMAEHVDGHQQDFARHVGAQDLAVVVEDQGAFNALLAETRDGSRDWHIDRDTGLRPGVAQLAAALTPLPAARSGKWRRLLAIWRPTK